MTEARSNTVNIPLLRKAVEWVEEQDKLPEIDREWLQASYQVDPIAHSHFLVTDIPTPSWERAAVQEQLIPHCGTAYCVAGYVGQLVDERYKHVQQIGDVHVSAVAIKALGLTDVQAKMLFHGTNDAERIRELAELFAGEKL